MISHIVAMSENRVIGLDGKMPWHLSDDLKRFKALTMGHSIVMGRKTFASIGKPLPGRTNIVITRQKDFSAPGIRIVSSLDDALELGASVGYETFIIGGGEIYAQSQALADKIYLTLIHQEIAGDTYYPEIDYSKYREMERQDFALPLAYSYINLEKFN
jgi:dihydrofolate reductase